MREFFYLEGAYLIFGAIVIGVAAFVATRPFMSKGALKKAMMGTIGVVALFIGLHYYMTTQRMAEVKTAFENGQTILCESRMLRKAAQFVEIRNDPVIGWKLEGDYFVSPHYTRPFFTARCIVKQ